MQSDFLFVRPSFIEGLARIFDFSGSLNEYNYSRNGAEADARAIACDWHVVGDDLYRAILTFEEEAAEQLAAYHERVKVLELGEMATSR